MGAALATLATAHIATQTAFKTPILYTFASPRVGEQEFAGHFEKLECYRIANSEDIVPTVPPATGKLIGQEMLTPSRQKNIEYIRKLRDTFTRNLSQQVYQHVGEPLYFTEQRGAISSNHNLFETYRETLPASAR